MTEYLYDEAGHPVLDLDLVISDEALAKLVSACRTPAALAAEGCAKPHKPVVVTVRYTTDPDVRVYTIPVMILETQPGVMVMRGEPIIGDNLTTIGRTLGRALADLVEGMNYAALAGRYAFRFDLCPSFDWADAHQQIMAILHQHLVGFETSEFVITEIDSEIETDDTNELTGQDGDGEAA